MPTDLSRDEMRRLARLGALRRLEELRQEEAQIRAAFPDLGGQAPRRRGRPPRQAQAGADAAGGAGRGRPRKRRVRRMSPAERRAVSERMRKYWAERRKAKAKS